MWPGVGPQVPLCATRADHLAQHLDLPRGPNAARHVDRMTLPCPLIQNRQAFQHPAIRAHIEQEVVGPDMIAPRRGRYPSVERDICINAQAHRPDKPRVCAYATCRRRADVPTGLFGPSPS
jgi:hypothetical protein